MHESAVLLLTAHGTASPSGSATTAALCESIRAARPEQPVEVCFLDVVRPSLSEALDRLRGREITVVPLLLSAGYHVLTDIPTAVAGRSGVRVSRHLGPDRLLVSALAERLDAVRGSTVPRSTVLVGVGSSRPDAAADVDATARMLSEHLGRDVRTATLSADLRSRLMQLTPPVEIATYLLAGGEFHEGLRQAAAGIATVAEPIGVHPALVQLVLQRYDETLR
jgi:sirohydrochlorin ferrochelatase